MIEFAADIDIPAPPRRVWDALIDFPSYPKWNPYVDLRGRVALGSEIEWSYPTRLVLKRARMPAVIGEFDELNAITWSLGVGWLFSIEERFRLYPTQDGTRLKHSMRCRGIVAELGRRPLRRSWPRLCAAQTRA